MFKMTSTHLRNILLDHCIVSVGNPTYLLTDNKLSFTGKIFTLFRRYLSSKIVMLTDFHPKTNGQARQGHRTVTPASKTKQPNINETGICISSNSYMRTTQKFFSRETRHHIVSYKVVIHQDHHSCTKHPPQRITRQHWIHNRRAVKSKLVSQRFVTKSTHTHNKKPSTIQDQLRPLNARDSVNQSWELQLRRQTAFRHNLGSLRRHTGRQHVNTYNKLQRRTVGSYSILGLWPHKTWAIRYQPPPSKNLFLINVKFNLKFYRSF